VYLDVIGTLPEPKEVGGFLDDATPNKRALLIDALLDRGEFADYWSLKWCDLLRVKAEFPINLWPNAVQAYHRWIRDSIRANKPYDQFARELLTSSGSNFREPPVNFYRAIQGREAPAIAEAVALTFMGTRLSSWPEQKRADMGAFFKRIAYKKTGEWKEEIVCVDPAPAESFNAVFPDGAKTTVKSDQDPRVVFADWLITPDNPWFARNIVNRVWSWLVGRGIIHEPDDIRPDNPPVNAELLASLEKELVKAKFDLRHIYRLVLNSETYQQSCVPKSEDPQAEALFAYYPVRRIEAEVLMDALCRLSGTGEGYSSMIPEPFTYVPSFQRSILLADGSITSPFLEMFGRPPRDTGFESERNNQPSDAQLLYMLNSSDIQKRVLRSPGLMQAIKANKGNRIEIIRAIYMGILSRAPTQDEIDAVRQYFQSGKPAPKQVVEDLAWALLNSKEFLYRH
jgi:hypothetical protein